MATARKRRAGAESEENECPVCMEAFETSGPRTKVRPYLCEDGVAHPLCSACDRTLYVRQDDRCPICRAGRSSSSVVRNGPRPMPVPMALPPPMEAVDPLQMVAGFGGHSIPFTQAQAISDVLSWLPRRVGAEGQRAIDGGWPRNHANSPLASALGGYGGGGGRAFYTDEGGAVDLGSVFIAAYRDAASMRRRRGEPMDLTRDDHGESGTPNTANTANDANDANVANVANVAFLAIMLARDEGIGHALDGLINLPNTPLATFARRVNGARRAGELRGAGHARASEV